MKVCRSDPCDSSRFAWAVECLINDGQRIRDTGGLGIVWRRSMGAEAGGAYSPQICLGITGLEYEVGLRYSSGLGEVERHAK